MEGAGCFGHVPEDHELHGAIADAFEIAIQQLQFLGSILVGGRGRSVPGDEQLFGRGPGFARGAGHEAEIEIAFVLEALHEGSGGFGGLRHEHGEGRFGLEILPGGLGLEAVLPGFQFKILQRARGKGRLFRLLQDLDIQREVADGLIESHGQGVAQGIAILLGEEGQLLFVGDDHALGAPRRNGVHAGLEAVAGHHLQQAGVHPAPHDALEHLAALGLLHHHAFPQLPVHVHGEARDCLAFAERKHQLAFQQTVLRVVDRHVPSGGGQSAHHLHINLQCLKLGGGFLAILGGDEDRRPGWGRLSQRQWLGRGRSLAGRQRTEGQKGSDEETAHQHGNSR